MADLRSTIRSSKQVIFVRSALLRHEGPVLESQTRVPKEAPRHLVRIVLGNLDDDVVSALVLHRRLGAAQALAEVIGSLGADAFADAIDELYYLVAGWSVHRC